MLVTFQGISGKRFRKFDGMENCSLYICVNTRAAFQIREDTYEPIPHVFAAIMRPYCPIGDLYLLYWNKEQEGWLSPTKRASAAQIN